MTNFERITKSPKELAECLLTETQKYTESWCENRQCSDANDDCIVCITKWLNEEVKMTNFEKWKKKLSETKNGHELIETIGKLYGARNERCHKLHNVPGTICPVNSDCGVCFEEWLDKEVEE